MIATLATNTKIPNRVKTQKIYPVGQSARGLAVTGCD